jgi:hypothetical protein
VLTLRSDSGCLWQVRLWYAITGELKMEWRKPLLFAAADRALRAHQVARLAACVRNLTLTTALGDSDGEENEEKERTAALRQHLLLDVCPKRGAACGERVPLGEWDDSNAFGWMNDTVALAAADARREQAQLAAQAAEAQRAAERDAEAAERAAAAVAAAETAARLWMPPRLSHAQLAACWQLWGVTHKPDGEQLHALMLETGIRTSALHPYFAQLRRRYRRHEEEDAFESGHAAGRRCTTAGCLGRLPGRTKVCGVCRQQQGQLQQTRADDDDE